jgi:hypothetical protein
VKIMEKYLLAAAAALTCFFAGMSICSAQTATFIYNDGNGAPAQGFYSPGTSFTFAIDLAFTPGGNISNLEGLSYWFTQRTPSGSPFNFAITLRDVTGPPVGGTASGPSPFTDLQTPGLTYPQNLNPTTAKDLGALLASGATPLGAGTYFVANITISIANTAALGEYVISNTTTGGKTSVITDSAGHTFAIPEADYIIDVIPEPATWLAPSLAAFALLLFTQRRRISRLRRAA